MTITITHDGKKVLEVATVADLKAKAQAPASTDKSNFKERHYISDAIKGADDKELKNDKELLLRIIKHVKQYGIEVNE
jgi:hypothetical protein